MNTVLILAAIFFFAIAFIAVFLYTRKRKRLHISHIEQYESGQIKRQYFTLLEKMDGKETTYYENGAVKSIFQWVNGNKKGPFSEYAIEGQITSKGIYKRNHRVADDFLYYPTGELNKIKRSVDGVPDGPFEIKFKNGNLYVKGSYSNGELKGKYLAYNTDGSIRYMHRY